jgi:hypothetical protein
MNEPRPEDNEDRDQAGEDDEPDGIEHRANVNQVRHEPMPASHHADPDQQAVQRNEEHSADAAARSGATNGDGAR